MSDSKDIRRIGVVILAAGGSSRLGQPKQLIKFQNKSLIQNIIDQSQAFTFASYVLVMGAHAAKIQKSIEPGNFNVIINENWAEGIASSIRKGVKYSLEIDPELEHILFLLSDQPFVTSELIHELVKTHRQQEKEITGCKYQDTVGVPAIFTKRLFQELSMLRGDRGARVLIKKYPDTLAVVPFDLGSIDVDIPEDYNKLINFSEKAAKKFK
jgi:molybdenum cofactor cytidylyltransferase